MKEKRLIGKYAKSRVAWLLVGAGLVGAMYLLVQMDREGVSQRMNVETQSELGPKSE